MPSLFVEDVRALAGRGTNRVSTLPGWYIYGRTLGLNSSIPTENARYLYHISCTRRFIFRGIYITN